MCVCVCLFVTALAATYLVYMSKVRQCTVSKDVYCVDIAENGSGDMALFACHNDR